MAVNEPIQIRPMMTFEVFCGTCNEMIGENLYHKEALLLRQRHRKGMEHRAKVLQQIAASFDSSSQPSPETESPSPSQP